MPKLKTFPKPSIGADPELFITKRKSVVSSDEVLTRNGNDGQYSLNGYGKIVQDGVQVELNPAYAFCRETFNVIMASLIHNLGDMLKYGEKIDRNVTIQLSKKRFGSLPDDKKMFGCQPSDNIHTKEQSVMTLDPSVYLYRSTGGHIHLGNPLAQTKNNPLSKVIQDPARLIPIIDIVAGNTLVLIDRDPGNVERRKNYGRAGEYRVQDYGLTSFGHPNIGIEYRTLSNFWLLAPELCSLATGLVRTALAICYDNLDKELLKLVELPKIIEAINNNDYELARANYNLYKDFLANLAGDNYTGFDKRTIEYLAGVGIENVFGKDIEKNWRSTRGIHSWRVSNQNAINEYLAKNKIQV